MLDDNDKTELISQTLQLCKIKLILTCSKLFIN